jgi:hypothetical protein
LLEKTGAWALRENGNPKELYPFLLNPPLCFCLSILRNEKTNPLQLAPVNNLCEVKTDTTLKFLLDGKEFSYSVYELEEGLRSGTNGREPGVRLLIDWLGAWDVGPGMEEIRQGRRGRPVTMPDAKSIKKVICKSGG